MSTDIYFKKLIREMIKKELEEISTSGAAGPYETPHAFTGKRTTMIRKRLKPSWGYNVLVHKMDDDDDAGDVDDLNESYRNMKNDSSMSSVQKIGKAISLIHKQTEHLETLLKNSLRLKRETSTGSQDLWKRTIRQLVRLEARLNSLSHKLREFKV